MPIYFVQVGKNGPVKIGYGKNPRRRLYNLQSGNPERLRLLGVTEGGKEIETSLHQKFQSHHISGEWFRPCEELLELISPLPFKQPTFKRPNPRKPRSRLSVYLEAEGLTANKFAKIVGSSQSAVCLWASGQRIPTRTFMDAIKLATNEAVTADDFHMPIVDKAS